MRTSERSAGLRLAVAAALAATVAAVPAVSSAGPGARAAAPVAHVDVVVQSTGERGAATAAVQAVRGTVTVDLPIVDGVAARVPASALGDLAAAPGVLAVTQNSSVTPAGLATTDAPSETVKQAFLQSTGAAKLHARGVVGTHRPGTPTRVALVDTGVDTDAATTGDLADRIVPVQDPRDPQAPQVACVDFSGERSCDDDYGHGTFMAGLIAGNGAASGGRFSGSAPGAEIVSIKIAGRTGASDVTKVLAAVQWAVSFRERYDIGVLNLSLGTNSRTDPRVDPLNRAVQRAWDSGIVVVAAAGNSGVPEQGQGWTVNKPADDPLVLTVGAIDDRETPGTSDDRVPRFSSRGGPGLAKPDVVAPGAHLVSLRAVGSTMDGVGTKLDATYRRGSGTSMSAAVMSGAVALLREARPTWTPDEVKHAVRATARKVALDDPYAIGRGLPHVYDALSADLTGAAQPRSAPAPLGLLDDSRRGLVVLGPECSALDPLLPVEEPSCVLSPLVGQITAQGLAFDGNEWTGHDWTEATWYASQWAGHDWTGHDWTGHDWTGHDWTGHDWTGHDWTGNDWTEADGSARSDDSETYGSDAAGDDSLVRGSLLYGSAD
ncbi:MAG: S8 family peptidase [Actinomycetota bacterium]|nr:S8 family peptidase [Actinomycetota bacterium]